MERDESEIGHRNHREILTWKSTIRGVFPSSFYLEFLNWDRILSGHILDRRKQSKSGPYIGKINGSDLLIDSLREESTLPTKSH